MKMSQMGLFSMARQQMGWLSERQTVLAQNIANANTPSYSAKDLKALDFSRQLSEVRSIDLKATAGRHLQGTIQRPDYRVEELRPREVYETTPDGNGVVMEEQLIKVSDTQMQYQLASNIYQKHMTMMRTALGSRSA